MDTVQIVEHTHNCISFFCKHLKQQLTSMCMTYLPPIQLNKDFPLFHISFYNQFVHFPPFSLYKQKHKKRVNNIKIHISCPTQYSKCIMNIISSLQVNFVTSLCNAYSGNELHLYSFDRIFYTSQTIADGQTHKSIY